MRRGAQVSLAKHEIDWAGAANRQTGFMLRGEEGGGGGLVDCLGVEKGLEGWEGEKGRLITIITYSFLRFCARNNVLTWTKVTSTG